MEYLTRFINHLISRARRVSRKSYFLTIPAFRHTLTTSCSTVFATPHTFLLLSMPPTVSKQNISFASAPTSPATTRRHSYNAGPLPVTPQRITRSAPRAQYRSPLTPATNASTPYTPLSLRSLSSNESTLTTPVSATSRHLSLCLSPEVGLDDKTENQKHFASIARNWRNRANENGIKVSSKGESPYEGRLYAR
jgi:hypothetical protein